MQRYLKEHRQTNCRTVSEDKTSSEIVFILDRHTHCRTVSEDWTSLGFLWKSHAFNAWEDEWYYPLFIDCSIICNLTSFITINCFIILPQSNHQTCSKSLRRRNNLNQIALFQVLVLQNERTKKSQFRWWVVNCHVLLPPLSISSITPLSFLVTPCHLEWRFSLFPYHCTR